MRMAESARENGIDLRDTAVVSLLAGGEPGASVPSTKARIEDSWGARLYDATGQSELGHHGFECMAQTGVHVVESEFYVEVLSLDSEEPVQDGEVGELVATSLGIAGMPAIRYRTGDLVRLTREPCECGRTFARFEGGILGRADGMIAVRGINIFPTAVENILLTFPEIGEFLVEVYQDRSLGEIRVQIEVDAEPGSEAAKGIVARVSHELRRQIALRAQVDPVPAGSLPRPPGKARRFVHHVA
jgi:phenylacetate-CoA ligase